jgi:hypothetical protein
LLFILLHFLFIFTYIQHLVLDNHSIELGMQDKEIFFAGYLTRTKRAFSTVPREFDIIPEFPHGENLFFIHHSVLGVPMKWHIT